MQWLDAPLKQARISVWLARWHPAQTIIETIFIASNWKLMMGAMEMIKLKSCLRRYL
jgi:hypothetical protein